MGTNFQRNNFRDRLRGQALVINGRLLRLAAPNDPEIIAPKAFPCFSCGPKSDEYGVNNQDGDGNENVNKQKL